MLETSEGFAELRARFERAAVAAAATRAAVATFEMLAERYAEPHRYYHTLTHIDACLTWLDWFRALARHPEEVELALWFHDAVYDPRAGGGQNERESARLACDALRELGVARAKLERIAGHVLATEAHAAAQGDAALVVDLDLTILGARRPEFDRFEEQIRKEYAHVPADQFRMGRRSVLESFLGRSAIYQAPQIRDELEARARENLQRRIAELSDASAR
jgi:predicted metal-dependent HD superfamily phosphohydrolase